MGKHKCQHSLALVSRVLHVDILRIGDIAHGIEIGLRDLSHADITLAGRRQLHVLLELVVVGKGERTNNRVLLFQAITGSVQLIHYSFCSRKRYACRQSHVDDQGLALKLREKIESHPTGTGQGKCDDETGEKDSAQCVANIQSFC